MWMKKMEEKLDTVLGSQASYKIAAFLILLGIVMGSFNTNQSYAWFTDTSENPFSLQSGKVHYVISYTTNAGLMIPGKELLSTCRVTNLSSIDTQFRLKLEYTVWEKDGAAQSKTTSSTAMYTTNAGITPGDTVKDKQYLNVAWATTGEGIAMFDSVTGAGINNTTDVFWQYHTKAPAVTTSALATGVEIPVFKDLSYDGPKTKNIFAGNPIVVKLTYRPSKPTM
ncbi:MAG: hypothetical protein RR361_03455 [Anaerovorax sp.]